MKKQSKVLLMVVVLLTGAVGLMTTMAFAPKGQGVSETHDPVIDSVARLPVSDPHLQQALHLMLTSDQRWTWLHVRARYTEYDHRADTASPSMPMDQVVGHTTFIEEIEIHQPFEVTYRQFLPGASQPRYEVALHDGNLRVTHAVTAQSGANVTESHLSLERLRRELALLPRTWEQIQPGVVIDHPLVRMIPARSMDMLFPTWIAQQATSQNRLFFEGEDEWLGRPAYRIRLEKPGGGTAVITAWIDQQTGILLRYRYEVAGKLLVEYEAQSIAIK